MDCGDHSYFCQGGFRSTEDGLTGSHRVNGVPEFAGVIGKGIAIVFFLAIGKFGDNSCLGTPVLGILNHCIFKFKAKLWIDHIGRGMGCVVENLNVWLN